MMKVTFQDWWCNPENYWTNGENVRLIENRQEFEDNKGKKVTINEKNIGIGKYPSLVQMEYIFNGKLEKTDKVKRIVLDKEAQFFLFEDYMIIGDQLNGSIYYYVDFSGTPVTDAWTNLTDTIYDKNNFWKYEENLKKGFSTNEPWLYGYNTSVLYEIISKELEERNSLLRKRVIEKIGKKERI